MARRSAPPPECCPVCGEDVPRNALACPECGADHESGWREDAGSIDAGGGDPGFDYDEFVQEEFGVSPKPRSLHLLWWLAALVVLAVFFLSWLFGLAHA